MNGTTQAADVWVWEFTDRNGDVLCGMAEREDLAELKKVVADSFGDHTWEEVERRGIRGTSILPKLSGRYQDTGHWVYRRTKNPPPFPGPPGSRWRDADGDMWILGDDGRLHAANCSLDPNEVAATYGPMMLVGGDQQ